MKTYDATLLRYAPDLASGERLNIGVAVFVQGHPASVMMLPSFRRIVAAFPQAHESALLRFAQHVTDVVRAQDLTQESFARAVLGREPGSIQLSTLSQGVTNNPAAKLEALFRAYVAPGPIGSVPSASSWKSDTLRARRTQVGRTPVAETEGEQVEYAAQPDLPLAS